MENDVMEKVISLIKAETDIGDITPDSNLFDDLEMSSLEVFSVFAELEEAFDIKLSENAIGGIATVKDIANVVTKVKEGK